MTGRTEGLREAAIWFFGDGMIPAVDEDGILEILACTDELGLRGRGLFLASGTPLPV